MTFHRRKRLETVAGDAFTKLAWVAPPRLLGDLRENLRLLARAKDTSRNEGTIPVPSKGISKLLKALRHIAQAKG